MSDPTSTSDDADTRTDPNGDVTEVKDVAIKKEENIPDSADAAEVTLDSNVIHDKTAQYSLPRSTNDVNLERQLIKAKKDLENMVIKYARSESENLQNKNKIIDLDKKLKRSIKDNESLANRIRILTNDKNSITETLNAKIAQLTVLEQRSNSLSSIQTEKLGDLEKRCAELEKVNEELTSQIDTYKQKEGELLDFSERLSMKHLLLQTELNKALENAPDYKTKFEKIMEDNRDLKSQNVHCLDMLDNLNKELLKEKDNNKNLQDEMAGLDVRYRRRVDELENEIKVMRRKHHIAAKEIYKQMKQISESSDGPVIKS